MKTKIQELIKKNQDQVVSWYREFHQIPELGFEEQETTAKIRSILSEMGITSKPLDPTGCVAYIGQGDQTIALRSDIDALAIDEATGLPFCSRHPGRMHACGHDGHMASLLGAARILKELEDALTIRVKLIFQPSEENAQGAHRIIEEGVLDDVDAIFGLHLFSDIPFGSLSVEAGPRMAQTDRFLINFQGKGGHASKPHLCVDATLMASEFVMSLQTIVSREVNPVEGAVVTVGALHSGTQYNIISDRAELAGTCRSYIEELAADMETSIRKRAHAVAEIHGGQVEIEYHRRTHPPVVNDAKLAGIIADKAEEMLEPGGPHLAHVPPMMGGEDFSWYQTKVPGVFAFVGIGDPDGGSYLNHHPAFRIDERALPHAVLLHLSAVMAVMDEKS